MQEFLEVTNKSTQHNKDFEHFVSLFSNPLKYQLFLIKNLPAAFFAGLKTTKLTPKQATVSVRYKWFNKNPFNSLYFAILSMAAEMSTGVLVLGNIYKKKPSVSMLVLKTEGEFFKKATGKILFTCMDGMQVQHAVANSLATGESQIIQCHSVGVNEENIEVARFSFTWSIKARR